MGLAKRRILVVDDESGLQKLVRRRAEREGLEVLEALTFADGLALAIAERPDLVLLDLHLPDGTGLALLEQLKGDPRTAHIPVVAWSGSDIIESETEVLKAGAAAYFDKRDLKALIEKISSVVRSN
jgi:two-component system, cell cycle response regulator DivK